MREDETEKAFMKPNEDDNDVVSVSDDTQDEQLLSPTIKGFRPSIKLLIYSSIFCSSM